jgi:hypothetical protein
MSPQVQKAAKSILYTVDTSGNQGNPTEFFIKNNMHATAASGFSGHNRRITLDDISATSQKRARLQKGFLDDSKVSKAVARDLMNSRPMYTVQEIQSNSGSTHRGMSNPPPVQPPGNTMILRSSLQGNPIRNNQLT